MTINWQEEVDKRRDDLMNDLVELLKIDSVRDDSQATAEAPVGPGPLKALKKFLSYGERDGFKTKLVDNLAGHIEYGEGDELLGVFGHVDVVPAGNGWNTDPFVPVIKDGKIYARGTSDDKGPAMAAYYGLKILKESGLPISKKVRFIIGTDEESGWKCMDAYLAKEQTPDFGFSPDAEFPIINGEKGISTVIVQTGGTNGGSYTLVSFEAGLRDNMVAQDASAVVKTADADKLAAAYKEFLASVPITGEAKVNGDEVTFTAVGKGSHAQRPMDGINAGTFLATFLNQFDFGGDAKNYLTVIEKYLHDDPLVNKFGLAHHDEKMGDLTMNPGVFSFVDGDKGTVSVNFRIPQGTTIEKIESTMKEKLTSFNVTLSSTGGADKTPHYVSPEDPLVKTLLDVYERNTGQKGEEQSIGGGTYGRLLERGVAFGGQFPGYEDTMHQANEYMVIDDILRSAVIYADALYELLK